MIKKLWASFKAKAVKKEVYKARTNEFKTMACTCGHVCTPVYKEFFGFVNSWLLTCPECGERMQSRYFHFVYSHITTKVFGFTVDRAIHWDDNYPWHWDDTKHKSVLFAHLPLVHLSDVW